MNTTSSKPDLGVDREHHAGRAEVGAHHALHAGRQRHVGVGEALVHAVADGAVVVERGEDLLDLVQHVVDAVHVEEGLLLAGERGVGQVLGGGRRAHRERRAADCPPPARRKRSRIAASSSGGNGVVDRSSRGSRRRPRPARARRRCRAPPAARRCARPARRGVRNSRKACAVVAKPPGTRTPAAASWLIISPREAFLPPTASTSVILSCSNGTTRAVASKVR